MYGDSEREEVIKHLKPYMGDPECTKDLRRCCEKSGCSKDLSECSGCPILELFYEVEYYRWCSINYV